MCFRWHNMGHFEAFIQRPACSGIECALSVSDETSSGKILKQRIKENIMKKLLIGAAVLVAVSLTHSMNAQAASTTGTANAKVIAGLTITAGANLNFGTIAP